MISSGIRSRCPSSSIGAISHWLSHTAPMLFLSRIHGRHCEFYFLMAILVHMQLPQFFFALYKVESP
jgi:hypothetical protein